MSSGYHSVYGEINNGAHQKPADLIGAPAFVWHQAFWNPVRGTREAREERANKIDRYIRALHARISVAGGELLSPQIKDIQIKYDDRVRVITLQFAWFGIRSKIRIENHTEYLTLTSIVDASINLSKVLSKTPDKLLSDNTLYGLLLTNIEHFCSGTHCTGDIGEPSVIPNDTPKFIYHDLWDEWFFPKLLDVDSYLSLVETDAHGNETLKIGGLRFVDIRGFVTCEQYPEPTKRNAEERTKDGKDGKDCTSILKLPIQGPFYKVEEERRGQWHRNLVPDERWARQRLDSAWPLLSLASGRDSLPLTGRTEFTVSRLLGGRTLYATALGPQPQLESTVPGLERPLLFYLHSITQCERQIGRTVDRLCQLETLRLATLMPLPALKSVPETLLKIEETIKATRDEIHRLIVRDDAQPGLIVTDDAQPDKLDIDIVKNLESIQREMGNLSGGRSIRESTVIGDASLEYRLQRSAYYKTIFFSLFSGIRVKRLEGYQPYEEFIKRRLQSAFGFIDSLEARIKAIKADWRAIDQLYLTTAITALTRQIEREQKVLALEQIHIEKLQKQGVTIQTNTQEAQTDIMWIQLVGEALLTTILVPYYLLGMLFHGLNCELDNWCAKTSVGGEGGVNVELLSTLIIFFSCLFVGIWRILYHWNRIKKRAHSITRTKA